MYLCCIMLYLLHYILLRLLGTKPLDAKPQCCSCTIRDYTSSKSVLQACPGEEHEQQRAQSDRGTCNPSMIHPSCHAAKKSA